MKRYLRWLIVAAIVVLAIVALQATIFRPRPIEVEVATVERGAVEDAVTNSQAGTVKARMRTQLGAERAGRVARIPHREGSTVKRGEVVLELDTSSAQLQLDLAQRDHEALQASFESATAAATLSRQDHERAWHLREQGLVSQEQMDQAKAKLDAASAELSAAKARLARTASAVRLARDEIEHLGVSAPFDGVVSSRYVEVGQSVIPGQPVLELVSLDRLYVVAPIDEIDIGRLKLGLPARVTLDPYPGIDWQGVVTRVSAVVNDIKEQNRTLDIDVELKPDATHPEPKPGTSADVQVILDRHDDVLRVPTFSVAEGKRVLVAENGRAVSRDIQTGIKNWEWTEVQGGLKTGEQVITNLDRQGLKPGVRVTAKARSDQAVPARGAGAQTERKNSRP